MGNGGCDMSGWNLLPDNLLLSLFSYLEAKDLVTVSEVCWHWARVSKDNSLWRRRLCLDFKLPSRTAISTFSNNGSWLSEYQRLTDEFPSVESETLRLHEDEVLHVAFSSDGSMFATSSKDCTLKIWQASYPCRLLYDKDLNALFNWKYTQFAQFNSDDRLILVSGVHIGPNSTSGEIAVFEIKDDDLEFRSRVLNKPYDVFGCWYNEDHVISGELHWISHLSSRSDIFLCAASQEIESERKAVMTRLFKFFNRNASTVHMALVSSHVSPWLRYAVEMTEKLVAAEKAGKELELDMDELSFENWEKTSQHTTGEASGASASADPAQDKLLIFCTGSLTYTPHQIGIKLLRGKAINDLLGAEVMPPEKMQAVMERIRLHREALENAGGHEEAEAGSDSDNESMEMEGDDGGGNEHNHHGDEDLNWQEVMEKFDFTDHFIEMHGHIIGMALTHDQRYLFVNVRPWPDGCLISDPLEPPPIAQQIEVRVIDLESLSLLDIRYTAHKGFTPNDECFFIFLDACDQFVASGSEDSTAYIWDRHYGCLLGKLSHTNVVNSVGFHPKNPSMLLSASDDHTIKVWRSKAFMRSVSSEID